MAPPTGNTTDTLVGTGEGGAGRAACEFTSGLHLT